MENHINDPEELQNTNPVGAPESVQEDTTQKEEDNTKSNETLDVESLDLEALVAALEKQLSGEGWLHNRENIDLLIQHFQSLFTTEFEAQKAQFLEEGGNEIDFSYRPLFKTQFEALYQDFKKKKHTHYKNRESQQKANQERKEEIINEIKLLIGKDENINTIYKTFKSLQESWYSTGPAPRAINNTLWQNFKHHVERFYDFLHLNRELRALDFQHNYEEKLKIIKKAEALCDHADIMKATRDLNTLHRMWKNDLGPVAKEHREVLWNRFQEASKKIHDRKQEYQKNFEEIQKENQNKKETLLAQMEQLITPAPESHGKWQTALKKFNSLRTEFQNIGYVPKAKSKQMWSRFRDISRAINQNKNEFYKAQKNAQRDNLNMAKELHAEIVSILEDENWQNKVNRVKSLQKEWRKVGHLPKKFLSLRNEFLNSCNLFFDRLKSGYQKMTPEDETLIKKRQTFMNKFKKVTLPDDVDQINAFLDNQWTEWVNLGDLSNSIALKTDEELLELGTSKIEKTQLDPSAKAQLGLYHLLRCMDNHSSALNNSHTKLKKEHDTLFNEVKQLENNLEFFSNSSSENPMVKELTNKLSKLQEQLEKIQLEMQQIKQFQNKKVKAARQAEEEAQTADDVAEGEAD
ncbi:MAG: DUF349 domain-containing protein [Flavobacteriaceae bacterium]